ncbi:hypothetical protein NKR23_g925 [Pleurostoma richardsiae]|uniref:Uncharacterized protein n=1 Tax=Pleurostoma richardsiae TaxID=41990 RepID=A0AA38RT93_9PEZI|nr:hypothetical protein NKR23_g925 [Pleurostoma richardsiae]
MKLSFLSLLFVGAACAAPAGHAKKDADAPAAVFPMVNLPSRRDTGVFPKGNLTVPTGVAFPTATGGPVILPRNLNSTVKRSAFNGSEQA